MERMTKTNFEDLYNKYDKDYTEHLINEFDGNKEYALKQKDLFGKAGFIYWYLSKCGLKFGVDEDVSYYEKYIDIDFFNEMVPSDYSNPE